MYEGIQSEILNTTRFDENSDLSTIYLGKSERSKNDKIKVEESFLISEQGYNLGKLLDGTECQILLDTGTSKLMRLLFQHFEQISTHLSKRMHHAKTLRAEIYQIEGSICR